MDELATVLRRERWLLSVLLFRLTEMRHLLSANDSRFLGWASAEVEDAVARVREAELIRNALVSRLAREMEMPEDDLTLSSLARVAPEPYRQIFAEHRAAFLELVNEVQSASQTNRRLATRGIQGLNETAEPTTGQSQIVTLKDARSTREDAEIIASLDMQLAQAGYQAALATAARVMLPTLVDFLH